MTAPLRIRPGTSDVRNFRDIYIEECYRLDSDWRPSLILDLGAYIGLASRWLEDRYPEAHVIAVEPNPALTTVLRKNAPRAEVHAVAVGGKEGSRALYPDAEQEWRASLHDHGRAGETLEVPTVTVDGILWGRCVDLVKVDVEGAEREIFEAGGDWLHHAQVIFLETHDRFVDGCTDAVRGALDDLGRPYTWEPRGGEDVVIRFGDAP